MCDIAILWSTTVYTCGPVLIKSQTLPQQYPNIGSTSRVCWLIGLSTTKSVTMVLSDARVPVCLSSYKLMDAREPSRLDGLKCCLLSDCPHNNMIFFYFTFTDQ